MVQHEIRLGLPLHVRVSDLTVSVPKLFGSDLLLRLRSRFEEVWLC